MIELKCEQRSPEWLKARVGVITATGYTNLPKNHMKYTFVKEKVAEIITGQAKVVDLSNNIYVQRGIEMEDTARGLYESVTSNKVTEIGFVFKDEKRKVGCSPDGLVGSDGLVEIKCPSTPVHLNNILSGPSIDYKRQMQFQMYCCKDRNWCDFVSWDDRVPEMPIYIQRIEKEVESQVEIEKLVQWALKSVDTKVEAIREAAKQFNVKYNLEKEL